MHFLLFIEVQINLVYRMPRQVSILSKNFVNRSTLLDDLLLVVFVIDLTLVLIQFLAISIYYLPSYHHVHLNFWRNIKSIIYLRPCSWCHRMLRNLLLSTIKAIPGSSYRYTHFRALNLLLLVLHAIWTNLETTLPWSSILLCGVTTNHLNWPTVVIG